MQDENVNVPEPQRPPWSRFERWSIAIAVLGMFTQIALTFAEFAMR
ncbi:hypothetical protein [Streptomyces albus]|nr:hypothetical protein [Streptomyces albus]